MAATTTIRQGAHDRGARLDARQTLVLEHLRLVQHVAAQVIRSTSVDVEFDELVSAGTIGLMNAIDKFDPKRGLAFSTFAAPRIRGSMLDDLRRRDYVPRSIRRKRRELSRARAKLTVALERSPTDRDLAGEMGVELSEVWRWKRDSEQAEQISLDRQIDPESSSGAGIDELLSTEDGDGIADLINRGEEIEILRDAILELKEQERVVVSLYYLEELKLREIAAMLNVTESRVSQIRGKAIESLRQRLQHLRD